MFAISKVILIYTILALITYIIILGISKVAKVKYSDRFEKINLIIIGTLVTFYIVALISIFIYRIKSVL